jgi:hypothetical protein
MNSSNPLNKVLPLCRAAVLPLDYLTATLQNRSTAILGKTAAPHNCSTAALGGQDA